MQVSFGWSGRLVAFASLRRQENETKALKPVVSRLPLARTGSRSRVGTKDASQHTILDSTRRWRCTRPLPKEPKSKLSTVYFSSSYTSRQINNLRSCRTRVSHRWKSSELAFQRLESATTTGIICEGCVYGVINTYTYAL